MDNQELLENLAQLERNLQDIEAARQMVDTTIQAYNGVLNHIESYSNQLATVSGRINQLITQISQNRDVLSSDIDERMQTALDKAEQISDGFDQKTDEHISRFEHDVTSQIQEMNTSVNAIVQDAQRVISQATAAANELQTQSVIALETAAKKVDTAASEIKETIGDLLVLYLTKNRKSMIVSTLILSVLIIGGVLLLLLIK